MAKVLGLFKTIRNNWKKSILFGCVFMYGANFARHKYLDSLIRQAYCLEAQKYGCEPLRTGERARRVTVFLNPAAHSGQAKALFDKNAAPLLHLAGLEVTMVKTEYEGQAKEYMDVIEKTDAILVAGGDGTLSEVVTGLLRNTEKGQVCCLPVGVIPVGSRNSLAQTLFTKHESEVTWLAECTMSVIRNIKKHVDVMQVDGAQGRSVFAISGLEWGAYRTVENIKKKYWYFGPLKDKLSYVVPTLKQWPPVVSAKLSYVLPCDGCSKCYTPPPQPVWKWWHFFLPPHRHVPEKNYSEVINDECGITHHRDITTMQFASKTADRQLHPAGSGRASITLEPECVSRQDFIKEGWSRLKNEAGGSSATTVAVSEFSLQPNIEQGVESWFTIDNELYEAMPIEAKLLRNKIEMFCCQEMTDNR